MNLSPAKFARKRWLKWLDRRIKPSREIRLDQSKIFIFPSRYGFFYLLTALMLFIGGINYENSLILNLCFLLVSLFIISILHTFRNLSGLVIKAGNSEDSFAGGQSLFDVILKREGEKAHQALNIIWHDNESGAKDVSDQFETKTRLILDTPTRGLFKPNRLKIQSTFPLGLIRAWSWVDIDMNSVVYPKPLQGELMQDDEADHGDGQRKVSRGQDDFDQLRRYQVGDSLKNIAWKHYARGQGLHTKVFTGYQSESEWLSWDSVSARNIEDKLSILCYWVLKFTEDNKLFGLSIPGTTIEPAVGKAHEKKCLKALALYGIDSSASGVKA
ncbi:MAG: DUF58 domain-containing protein [Pseudomonadales bacterium]|nr:DUF58 domain-containing protein [Pseudomonadales bacterium]